MNKKAKIPCSVCGTLGVTDAHVKDKALCGDLHDDTYTNIIQMCYSCHYEYFDNNRMGIIKIKDKPTLFVFLDKENEIQVRESKNLINVRDEYIDWKNKRCIPKLRIYILRNK